VVRKNRAGHWLDPFGGVLKNVLIAAVLGALLILEPRR
jgi:hypothetical protein